MRDLYVSIIRKVKETVSIPVMIKMSKMVGNIPAVAHTLTVNGADGIVLFNRFTNRISTSTICKLSQVTFSVTIPT